MNSNYIKYIWQLKVKTIKKHNNILMISKSIINHQILGI